MEQQRNEHRRAMGRMNCTSGDLHGDVEAALESDNAVRGRLCGRDGSRRHEEGARKRVAKLFLFGTVRH